MIVSQYLVGISDHGMCGDIFAFSGKAGSAFCDWSIYLNNMKALDRLADFPGWQRQSSDDTDSGHNQSMSNQELISMWRSVFGDPDDMKIKPECLKNN